MSGSDAGANALPVDIRQARPEEDLDLLVATLGQREYFADRLSKQKCGNGALWTAWVDNRPIGVAYLWLEEAEERELRDYLPGVPLLTHVEIHHGFRSRLVGTRLITAAEAWLTEPKQTDPALTDVARAPAELQYRAVALAVERANVRAVRLYERLGYRRWRHSRVPYLTCAPFDEGQPPEICDVMIKDLPVTRGE
jgi:GNAT superfamily N-acetyltransferase